MTSSPPPPPPPPSSAANSGAGTTGSFASWGSRVGAYLIDWLIAVIPGAIITGIGVATGGGGTDGMALLGGGIGLLGYLVTLVVVLWNQGWREGTTGQSIGKGVIDIATVEESGGYLGGGQGILRVILMGLLGGLCFLNYLWPLFDDQNRAWHDMIINSRVVTTA